MAATFIIPAGLFIILFDPKLTMPRDWDLFAIPVTIGVVPLILIGLGGLPETNRKIMARLTSAIAVACVFTAGWVAVNAYIPAHLARAEYYLAKAERHQGWGYEVLGMYYHQQGDYDNEVRMLRSLPPEARPVRYYGKLATALWAQGTDIGFFRSVVEREPRNIEAWCKLGSALIQADSISGAEQAFLQAQAVDSTAACVWYGWAEWWLIGDDTARARESCLRGIMYNPEDSSGLDIRQALGLSSDSE
jgi:tetratricopeptide (TPR) repeat protein